jgi:hypothetical protein
MTMAIVIEQLLTAKAQGREIVGIEAGRGFKRMLKEEYRWELPESAEVIFCGLPITWNYEIEGYQFIGK